jgi:predicted ester cyclase
MTTTNIKKLVERLPLEVFNQGKYELIDQLVASDFVEHFVQPGFAPTRDGFKKGAIALKTAFPDLHYVIEDSIEDGDRIVQRATGSGTMTGDFMGMSATGKRAYWTEIHIARVANDRIVEHWALADHLGMLVQLGLVPVPGKTPVTV